MNKKLKIILIITILFNLSIFPISKKLKEINISPILNINLDSNINIKSTLLKENNFKKYNYILGYNIKELISIRNLNDTIKDVYRHIEIYQFETKVEAENEFNSYKKTFLKSKSSKIYKEENNGNKKSYILYKTIRFNYNHGIPCGLWNDPDIWVGFLINNYFINISYNSYSDMENTDTLNYTRIINEDIILTANFLNDIIKVNKK